MIRYPASTILALLREVSQIADVDAKIDWHALVNKTETGITSAREYQILWRHLAYRHPLFDYIAPDEPPIVSFLFQQNNSLILCL